MKIYEFRAENFKGLKVVEITPDGNVVQITGRNGQGKTSVLDGIWAALSGRFAAGLEKPVREGADGASVTVTTDDLVISRIWNGEGKPSLRVENREGKRFSSPQAVLDALVGALSFDPLAFTRQSPREQRETLISLVDLGYDPDEVERRIKAIYDERTSVGRELKTAQGAYDECPVAPGGTPEEEVSVSALMKDLSEAEAQKQKNANLRFDLHSDELHLSNVRQKIEELKAELLETQQQEKKIASEVEREKAAVSKLVDPDIDAIRERLTQADTVNANVRIKRQMVDLEEKVKTKRSEYDGLTAKLNQTQHLKAEALKSVKFPVPGLGFDDDGVVFNGIPFSQASSAEQLKVSLGIAMALNPELRVIRILDGSLLDEDSMKELCAMAEEKDYQVWVERVDSTGKVGVVIEDGYVREVK